MEESRNVVSRVVGSANADLDSLARLDLGSEFRIDRVLAERPGALTYLAHETERKRPVVLRVRDKKALEAAGLLDALEGSLAEVAALGHQSIVPIYGFGLGEHTVWWTSQFVHAQSLADLVRSEGRLPLERTIRIAGRVADALLHAHDRGVAHGDVSPTNLLIRTADWVVVKDFVRPEAWLPNVARLETARRSPDGDQRSLAITIYRCLIGDVDRPTAGLIAELASAAALTVRRPDFTPSVVTALVSGADSDSSRQFGSVVELVAALQAPPTPNAANALPEGEPSPKLTKVPERRRILITALALVTIVVAGLWSIRWLASTRDRGAPSRLATRDTPVLPAPKSVAPAIPPAPVATPREVDTVATPSQVDAVPPPSTPEPVVEAVTPTRVERVTRLAPAGSARLFVSSVPGGTLYIDNRLIGSTPRSRLPVAAGRHVIRITRPGYRRYLSMIEVTAGEERRLTHLVLERER